MKTISISELHERTDEWVHRAGEEKEIIVTDGIRAVAVLHPFRAEVSPSLSWKDRPLLPAYAASLQAGRFTSKHDSTQIISSERDGWR